MHFQSNFQAICIKPPSIQIYSLDSNHLREKSSALSEHFQAICIGIPSIRSIQNPRGNFRPISEQFQSSSRETFKPISNEILHFHDTRLNAIPQGVVFSKHFRAVPVQFQSNFHGTRLSEIPQRVQSSSSAVLVEF